MSVASGDIFERRWVHSHEEDTADTMVFRAASFKFPRSRGRTSFELKADGALVERSPGAADRSQETYGRWDLEDDQRLAFRPAPGAPPHRVFHIVSASPDRLVLKR